MAKSDKLDRRAAVDQIRRQQQRADQRQGMIIIGVCAVVMVVIIGAAAYRPVKDWWDERQYAGQDLEDVGAPASVCEPIITKKATSTPGATSHVDPGIPVVYKEAPPAFGQHENVPELMEGKFYTDDDRPNIEKLVHNLEHGYTIVWYDESIADDSEAIAMLRAIGGKLDSTSNLREKFKIAPWTDDDGKAFPGGAHIAFTHWATESKEEGDAANPQGYGVWQYCSEMSGEALVGFMTKYDYTNSPEPQGG